MLAQAITRKHWLQKNKFIINLEVFNATRLGWYQVFINSSPNAIEVESFSAWSITKRSVWCSVSLVLGFTSNTTLDRKIQSYYEWFYPGKRCSTSSNVYSKALVLSRLRALSTQITAVMPNTSSRTCLTNLKTSSSIGNSWRKAISIMLSKSLEFTGIDSKTLGS